MNIYLIICMIYNIIHDYLHTVKHIIIIPNKACNNWYDETTRNICKPGTWQRMSSESPGGYTWTICMCFKPIQRKCPRLRCSHLRLQEIAKPVAKTSVRFGGLNISQHGLWHDDIPRNCRVAWKSTFNAEQQYHQELVANSLIWLNSKDFNGRLITLFQHLNTEYVASEVIDSWLSHVLIIWCMYQIVPLLHVIESYTTMLKVPEASLRSQNSNQSNPHWTSLQPAWGPWQNGWCCCGPSHCSCTVAPSCSL